MSATAPAAYLWGRGALGEWWAVAAAVLMVAVPGLAYSGLIMSEVAIYLLATLALWAIASTLARPPTHGRRSCWLRSWSIVDPCPAGCARSRAVCAVALQCGFERSLDPARRPTALLAVTSGAAASTSWASRRRPLERSLRRVCRRRRRLRVRAGGRDVLWHTGGAFVLVAGIPLVALGLMLVECAAGAARPCGRGARRDRERLVGLPRAGSRDLCVALGRPPCAERLHPVAPPILLVFGLWLSRGAPRPAPGPPGRRSSWQCRSLLLPVSRFAVQEAALDAFSYIPLWRLAAATSESTLEIVFPLCAGVLVAAAVLTPRRALAVLPASSCSWS